MKRLVILLALLLATPVWGADTLVQVDMMALDGTVQSIPDVNSDYIIIWNAAAAAQSYIYACLGADPQLGTNGIEVSPDRVPALRKAAGAIRNCKVYSPSGTTIAIEWYKRY